jgi:cytochrome c oxidase assembly protein subunit 15
MLEKSTIEKYLRMNYFTIGIVIFLILVGGIVRGTGSGMGCPDWPKCFGMWIPPTCACQLPDKYLHTGLIFNAVQTWIEYVNRLIGALTGLFILGSFYFSLPFRKSAKSVFWLSLLGVFLVGFEGWLGKKVVDTNLKEGMITIHMVVAMILLMVLIISQMIARAKIISYPYNEKAVNLAKMGLGICALTLIQIILGTQVRENVDVVAIKLGEAKRGEWIAALSEIYRYHTSFYWLLTLGLGYWFFKLKDLFEEYTIIKNLSFSVLGILFSEIAIGFLLNAFAIPPILQPLHLLLGTLLFAVCFTLVGFLWQIGRKVA